MSVLAVLLLAVATNAAGHRCGDLVDAGERLACFDAWDKQERAGSATPAGATTSEDTDPNDAPPLDWLVLRNDASPYPRPDAEFGSKGASIGYLRDDGEEYYTAGVSLMLVFSRRRSSEDYQEREESDIGWQPFLLAQWKRSDSPGKDPTDVRILGAGLAIISNADGLDHGVGFNIWPTLYQKKDIYEDTDSTVASVYVDLISPGLASTNLDSLTETTFMVTPFFGALYEHRNGSGAQDGGWSSAYAGLDLTSRLSFISPRLEANLRWQYFSDVASPNGTDARNEDFGSFGLTLRLSDPADTTARWRPALSLKREIGTNPLISPNPIAQTTLGLTIEVDPWPRTR